jgi:hypothetical protein
MDGATEVSSNRGIIECTPMGGEMQIINIENSRCGCDGLGDPAF